MKTSMLLSLLLAAGAARAAAPVPTLEISPSSFSIDAPAGGPDPSPRTLDIRNIGTDKLDWTATDNQPWLSISPASGKLHDGESIGVSVLVNTSGLAPGSYTGIITVSAPGGANSPQTSSVSLQIQAAPRIGASPVSLTFAAPQGGPNPSSQTLAIQNTGSGTLNWSVGSNSSWLQASPGSGSLGPAASQNVSVWVDVAGLAAGPYSGSLTIIASGASNSPLTIGVNLTVNSLAAIELSPTSLLFEAPSTGPNPPSKTMSVRNQGSGTLNWSAADNAAWLTVSPTSGSLAAGLSQTLTVSVNATGLAEGSHPATITVTASGASNSPQTVSVNLNVNAQPKIGVNPASISFVVAADGGSSAPQAVSVTNTGAGTLVWTISGGASWLSAGPSGGTLAALSSEPLLLTASPSGLSPGVYTTTVVVQDPNASNTSRVIAVELTVVPSALPSNAPAGQCGLLGLELFLLLALARGGVACRSR